MGCAVSGVSSVTNLVFATGPFVTLYLVFPAEMCCGVEHRPGRIAELPRRSIEIPRGDLASFHRRKEKLKKDKLSDKFYVF